MEQYLPILAMLVLTVLFAAGSFFASKLLGPRRPTSAKQAPYECGIVPEVEAAERFPVKFYLVAMAFIVLDVEIIFLYPFTTVLRDLGARPFSTGNRPSANSPFRPVNPALPCFKPLLKPIPGRPSRPASTPTPLGPTFQGAGHLIAPSLKPWRASAWARRRLT